MPHDSPVSPKTTKNALFHPPEEPGQGLRTPRRSPSLRLLLLLAEVPSCCQGGDLIIYLCQVSHARLIDSNIAMHESRRQSQLAHQRWSDRLL